MSPLLNSRMSEPLALARPLAIVLALGLVGASAVLGGPRHALAAAVGAVISLANVWVLGRLAGRAARQALNDPQTAAGGLQAALGAKTIVLLFTVATAGGLAGLGGPGLPMLPFGLGLLVTAAALILAGLTVAASRQYN